MSKDTEAGDTFSSGEEERVRENWMRNSVSWAKLVDNRGTRHHREILIPCLFRLLGDVRSKRILDAGCGEGYLAREIARRGGNVIGVDFSPSLIEQAEQLSKRQGLDIMYRLGDLKWMPFVESESQDIVLTNLCLINVPDSIFSNVIGEFSRILRRGGYLVASLVHPAFDGAGSWKLDKENLVGGRPRGICHCMTNYLFHQKWSWVWKDQDGNPFPEPVLFFHRPISFYSSILRESGFTIVELAEPSPIGDALDMWFDKERRIPFFLVIHAQRL